MSRTAEKTIFAATREPILVREAFIILSSSAFRSEVQPGDRLIRAVDRLAPLVATEDEAQIHIDAYKRHVPNASKGKLGAWAVALKVLRDSDYLKPEEITTAAMTLSERSQYLGAPKVADFAKDVYNEAVTKDSSVI